MWVCVLTLWNENTSEYIWSLKQPTASLLPVVTVMQYSNYLTRAELKGQLKGKIAQLEQWSISSWVDMSTVIAQATTGV